MTPPLTGTAYRRRRPPAVTWDQASILQYATVNALVEVYGWSLITLRRALDAGHLHPVATAPGGAHLLHVPTVLAAADRLDWNRKETRSNPRSEVAPEP